MSNICIAPSLAAGNLLQLETEVRRLEQGGADAIHFDVMDGHFVPLLTIGVPFLEAVRKVTKLTLDVHIMVTNPDHVAQHYLDAGADILTFPIETATHAHRLCQHIRAAGRKAGVVLNPSTHWNAVEFLLPCLDQITIMAVNPGYSRQSHIAEVHPKIKTLAEHCKQHFPNIVLQVDGGVNLNNIGALAKLGATNFVTGGAVMGQPDYKKTIDDLRSAAEKGRA
jgi:ribulose-phosphate 3-epimerase